MDNVVVPRYKAFYCMAVQDVATNINIDIEGSFAGSSYRSVALVFKIKTIVGTFLWSLCRAAGRFISFPTEKL